MVLTIDESFMDELSVVQGIGAFEGCRKYFRAVRVGLQHFAVDALAKPVRHLLVVL